MVIISKTVLHKYINKRPEVAEPLNEWYNRVKQADWNSLYDVKQTFNAVDFVGNDRFVFNIKGNQYRLVAMIFFSVRTLYIKFIGSHSEYDKIDVSTIDLKD
jgi:mRNA interferase HigB